MSVILAIKTILIIFDAILLLGFVYVFYKALGYRPNFTVHTKPRKRTLTLRDAVFKERWEEIVKKVDVGSVESIKLAIIEADKMVDDVLKRLGFEGQHMADRMEQIGEDECASLWKLWRAHRVRNNIVHTPGFVTTPEDAQRTIHDFAAFLKEVEVL